MIEGEYTLKSVFRSVFRWLRNKGDLINSGNFNKLYQELEEDLSYCVNYELPTLTAILLNSGIDLLAYMPEIIDRMYASLNIEKVNIPNNITRIGKKAFWGCEELKEIVIADSVKIIDDQAFVMCESLKSIIFPPSIEKIGFDLFASCDKLKNIYYAGSEEEFKKIKIAKGNEDWINTVEFLK